MIFLVIAIVSGIIGILCSIVALLCEVFKVGKDTRLPASIASVLGLVIAVVTLFMTDLPEPNILPLDNESQIYTGNLEITMTSNDDLCTIYYSTDGTDPKDGYVYNDKIIISETTTVCARNNFWWWWSDIIKSPYEFEETEYDAEEDELDEFKNTSGLKENSTVFKLHPDELEEQNEVEEKNNSDQANDTHLQTQTTVETKIEEGLNIAEGHNLMLYINQYRTENGLEELIWNDDLEREAQYIASVYAVDGAQPAGNGYHIIGRQCNGAKNAQKAVSDWISGNSYILSEAGCLLSADYTQIGGALYYLPDGNEYGYHYFWIICLK